MHGQGCSVGMVSCLLVKIGALNWGLVGLGMLLGNGSSWNLVNILLGAWPTVEAVVYLLVGLAAIHAVWSYMSGGCCGGMCKK
jgi:uncharacterized membrane protein YuzA (DUF378 family)